MSTHFIIPDTHFKPGMDFTHVKWLARCINDIKPDKLIHLGDWADFESLSSYDRGKRSHEQKRYVKDVAAANQALDILESNLTVNPKKIYIAGNHDEGRIKKAIDEDPQRCEGMLSMDDIKFKEAGWKVIPFGKPHREDGILYCHYFSGGVMGRPIGGENPATKLLTTQYVSCTAGHTHTRDFSERTRADGQRILGLIAGCFLPHDYRPSYAGTMPRNLWWSGVTIKEDVKDGYYNPRFIDFDAIKDRYAQKKSKRRGR
jgi:predicted MPP superfamily phosphohydrolase